MVTEFRRKTDSLPTCMSCGSVLYGGYCSQCGQENAERITFERLWRRFRSRCLRLDHPWPRTVGALTQNPGRAVRAYLRGKRLPFVGPFTYALTTALILIAVSLWPAVGLSTPGTPWGAHHVTADMSVSDASVGTFRFAALSVFWVSGLVARFQWSLFRREKYSATETWVFVLFIFGHLALLEALFVALGAFSSQVGLVSLAIAHGGGLSFALSCFYRRPWWRVLPAAAILETLFVAGVFTSASCWRLAFG